MKLLMLKMLVCLQAVYARACLALDRTRRLLLNAWLLKGGRDMYFLTNGAWVDCTQQYSPEQIEWLYNSETNTIYKPMDAIGCRTRRWDWLSVVAEGDRDMSDFFSSLRVSHTISADKVLTLFAHQKGWSPTGRLQVVLRTGEEEVVDAISGRQVHHPDVAPMRLNELNYIR
jgi:hypothetical protein